MKNVKATGEASRLQGEQPELYKFIHFFLFLRFIYALLDPEPADPNQCGPCGSGSAKQYKQLSSS